MIVDFVRELERYLPKWYCEQSKAFNRSVNFWDFKDYKTYVKAHDEHIMNKYEEVQRK